MKIVTFLVFVIITCSYAAQMWISPCGFVYRKYLHGIRHGTLREIINNIKTQLDETKLLLESPELKIMDDFKHQNQDLLSGRQLLKPVDFEYETDFNKFKKFLPEMYNNLRDLAFVLKIANDELESIEHLPKKNVLGQIISSNSMVDLAMRKLGISIATSDNIFIPNEYLHIGDNEHTTKFLKHNAFLVQYKTLITAAITVIQDL